MESRSSKFKGKTRPLTKNEKFLLTALGIILLLWISFKFVFDPQAEKMSELENKKEMYESEIIEYNRVLRNEKKIEEELEILTRERDKILSSYFPSLDQSQILYLLNDLMADDRLDVDDISFTRPSIESKGEMDIYKMDISIPLTGSYDGIYDIVEAINHSPRRILINNLDLHRESDRLTGNMNLKIYSLEGLAKIDRDVIHVDIAEGASKDTPFTPYRDYLGPIGHIEEIDGENEETGGDIIADIEEVKTGEVLHEFDNRMYQFIPSSSRVKGNVMQSTIKKSGRYSMRLEYDILALEDINRVYVNLLGQDIVLKYPPNSLGVWVYSYGYSPGTLGLQLRDQVGEVYDLEIAQGISWRGWEYLQASPLQDIKLYPLTLERIYFEIPYEREDFGVVLIDRLEAFYPESSSSDEDNNINEFYVVKEGDTISDISRKIYGTLDYKNEIMKLNDIKSEQVLPVGKILVLRRH